MIARLEAGNGDDDQVVQLGALLTDVILSPPKLDQVWIVAHHGLSWSGWNGHGPMIGEDLTDQATGPRVSWDCRGTIYIGGRSAG
jgi:hypothetical protein